MLQKRHSMKREILPLKEFQRIYPQNKESPGGTSPCPQMSSSPLAPVSLWVWGANTSDEESFTAAVQVNKPNSGWCRLNTTKGSTSLRKMANPSKTSTFSSHQHATSALPFNSEALQLESCFQTYQTWREQIGMKCQRWKHDNNNLDEFKELS